ncbi:restriction endonuclease subunit S [Algibacter sp.]|nr:restriction endonuclease subunit S [Algibacter sp.]
MELIQEKQSNQLKYPIDWGILNLGKSSVLKARIGWQGLTTAEYLDAGDYYLITGTDFKNGYIDWDNCVYVEKLRYDQDKNIQVKENDVLVTKDGTIGKVAFVNNVPKKTTLNSGVFVIRPVHKSYYPRYFYYVLMSEHFKDFLGKLTAGSTISHLYQKDFVHYEFPLPPTLTEQKAIATTLSDVDALIASLKQTITKKKAIKQGAMQQLLTPPHKGGKRLPGFSGEWEYLPIELVADCLDNLRVPLNGEQRNKMSGDIPYCGANGVVDYVDDYVVDDDIILMAEDGGYFDEYKSRHIAYRMIGKCWVNNHAHILKAKKHINQAYLFYTLVHKNILDYINGGTRAKLNKSEMNKIESWFPCSQNEQKAIAQILSDMDAEITQLEAKKEKYQAIKQGMMQELLTGKTRLV